MLNRIFPAFMGRNKYDTSSNLPKVLNDSLNVFLKDAVRVTITRPSQAYHFFKIVRWQKQASKTRENWEGKGVHIPPIIIYSITNRCNLNCKGCFHWALHEAGDVEMSDEKLRNTIAEAKAIGVSIMVIGGGEPMMRPEIIDITSEFPEVIFLVFTNGLLLDEEKLDRIQKNRNFVPVLSLEGDRAGTDFRRGEGVYAGLEKIIRKLKKRNIFWSVSLTLTRLNYDTIMDDDFVGKLVNQGCKLMFFVEYTPITEETEDWLISDEQRENLIAKRDEFRKKHPALFIAVPGDEEEIGGCLSAGRGFVHINPLGDVEPCPFAPYSDTNLRDTPLIEALQSDFLKEIRDNHDHLSETEGGCALWVERKWVQSVFQESKTR
ncbi:MAG: radical SAM protein [Dehalococcoidales bacterium]|nr:MAG: radical SAM protein [Dehalococcoidales bacterium]